MKIFKQITVDLYNPFPLQKIVTQQNNIGRGVIVTLTAGSEIVDPSEEDVKLWAKRPDGNVSYLPCTVQADGTIKAPFSSQMLSITGSVIVSLEMISGEDDITTPIFIIDNNVNISDHNAAESTNEFTALQMAISQMNTSMQEVEKLKKEGLKGDPGIAATVRVGSVSASDPGGNPVITNSGTENNAILDFVLPRGIQGPNGEPPDTEDPMTATEYGVPADSLKTREEFEKKLYLSDVVDPALVTQEGFAADALKVKEQFSEQNKNFSNMLLLKNLGTINRNINVDRTEPNSIFELNGYDDTVTGFPHNWGIFIHIAPMPIYHAQILFGANGCSYHRFYNGSIWTDWM